MDIQIFLKYLLNNGTIILVDDLAKKGNDILYYLTNIKEKKCVVVDAKELKGKQGKIQLINAMKEAETEQKVFFLDNALNLPKSPEREEIANLLFYLVKGEEIEGANSQNFPVLVANVPTEKSFDYLEGRLRDFTHLCCSEIEGLDIYREGSSSTVYESLNKGRRVKVTHSDFIQTPSTQILKVIKEK